MEKQKTILGLYDNYSQRVAFYTYLLKDDDTFNLSQSKSCAVIEEDLKNDTYNVIIKGIELRVPRRYYGVILKSEVN